MTAYRNLAPGDPWTEIRDEPICDENGEIQPGAVFTKWFDTSEPGRAFRVVKVTRSTDRFAYESVFIGFLIVSDNGDETISAQIEESVPDEVDA